MIGNQRQELSGSQSLTLRRGARTLLRCALVLAVVAAALVSFFVGTGFGRRYAFNSLIYDLPRRDNLRMTLKQTLGMQHSYGQFQQDLWVAYKVGHGKTSGYYVDVGSADGEFISNTKLLDEMGWKGICIDPFPRNMQKRKCQVFAQPIYRESGRKVQFRAAGDLGGIEGQEGKARARTLKSPLVEFTTATLDEVLQKAGAPKHIDYMNLDIEGGEVDALRGLSLDKYEIGSLTIEHNFETEKRELIRKILAERGYVRVRSWEVDDWYVNRDSTAYYRGFLGYASKGFLSSLLNENWIQ